MRAGNRQSAKVMNGMPVIVTDVGHKRSAVRALNGRNGRQTITGTFTMPRPRAEGRLAALRAQIVSMTLSS